MAQRSRRQRNSMPPSSEPAGVSPDDLPWAWRLTFSYRDDSIELISRQRVQMRAPPSDEGEAGQGVHVEVQDVRGNAVYRKRIHDPIARDRAVFSPDPDVPIRRVLMPQARGAFQVVVPDLPEAESFVLQGASEGSDASGGGTLRSASKSTTAAAGQKEGRGGAQELVRVPLKDDAEGKERPRR